MNQKGFSLITVMVGVMAVALLGGGLFYAGRMTVPKTQPQEVSPKVETPKATDVTTKESPISSVNKSDKVDETANWQTYQSNDKQYSLKYPSSFSLSNYNEGAYRGIALLYLGPIQTASGRTETSVIDSLVIKTLLITDTNQSLQEFAEAQRKNEENALPIAPTVSPLSQLTVSGKSAFTYTTEGQGTAKVVLVKLNSGVLKIIGLYDGDTTTKLKYLNLFTQILTTFK